VYVCLYGVYITHLPKSLFLFLFLKEEEEEVVEGEGEAEEEEGEPLVPMSMAIVSSMHDD
jgi:hypothetical protein